LLDDHKQPNISFLREGHQEGERETLCSAVWRCESVRVLSHQLLRPQSSWVASGLCQSSALAAAVCTYCRTMRFGIYT